MLIIWARRLIRFRQWLVGSWEDLSYFIWMGGLLEFVAFLFGTIGWLSPAGAPSRLLFPSSWWACVGLVHLIIWGIVSAMTALVIMVGWICEAVRWTNRRFWQQVQATADRPLPALTYSELRKAPQGALSAPSQPDAGALEFAPEPHAGCDCRFCEFLRRPRTGQVLRKEA